MLVNTNLSKILLLIGLFVAGNNIAYSQVWTLEKCVESANAHNKRLKISNNDKIIIEQKQKEAKANLLPKITANGDYKYYMDLPTQLMPLSIFGGPEGQYKEAQFGVPHNINANIQFAMPLYKPEIYGGIEATKIAGQVADLQHQKTEDEIYFDIAKTYYNAQIIKNQLNFLDSNWINSKQLLENIILLNEQLLVQKTDVDKVQLQVQQIETKKIILQSKYQQVLNSLKMMMGIPLSTPIDVETQIVKKGEISYASKSTIDLQLLDAKFSLLSSEINTLKKTRYLPSAYLYGSYGVMGYGFAESPNDFLNFYSLGFVGAKVSYPIFNGMITNKKIKQKTIEIANNELKKELVKDQQNMLVENAQLQRKVSQEIINSNELQIELAKSIYKNTVLLQKEGVATLTDILLADNALREAQQNYITAIIDYLKADLELKKLTGNI